MAERSRAAGQQRYDREGLYAWATQRFSDFTDQLKEEEFRTLSRLKLRDLLLDLSRKGYPSTTQDQLDEKLEEVLAGSKTVSTEQATTLKTWAKSDVDLEVNVEEISGADYDKARRILWDAYDRRYRPEMRQMERSLLLSMLDSAWKNHLHTMDHLRAGVRLRWVGQMDPKIEYKREGMKEFESMWQGVEDKVTDTVFRMEEAEGVQETVWQITSTIHEEAARLLPQEDPNQMATSSSGEKKSAPIRNRTERVGRNEKCPCGSGKKYKNCCLKVRK